MKKINPIVILASIFWILFVCIIMMNWGNATDIQTKNEKISKLFSNPENTINMISSFENKDLDKVLKQYALYKNYDVNIEYAGTIEIMNRINSGEKYDAAWISDTMWLSMLSETIQYSDIEYTHINPIVVVLKESVYKENEILEKKDISMKDILNIINSKKYSIAMTDPKTTSLGETTYLNFIYALTDNYPEVAEELIQNIDFINNIKNVFENIEFISEDIDEIEEIFTSEKYEIGFLYESMAININRKLEAEGKGTLCIVYPIDSISSANSAMLYIDQGVNSQKENLLDLQNYISSLEGKRTLWKYGRRFWYGGRYDSADQTIFNREWGIKTEDYISSQKYPNIDFIQKTALNIIAQ